MADVAANDEKRLGSVDTSFYLIGVGASAGGLEAIRAFLSPVPEDCRYSFVLVQHLSPDYKSLMGDLLRRETSLPIKEVEENLIVEPGYVYLIPPRANVVIQGTHPGANFSTTNAEIVERSHDGLRFSLIDQPPRSQLNLPIDLFFQSLAEDAGNRAVAVVLSGTGSDGSRGLRAVKDVDGIVMTQLPETAKFDGMLRAAAATEIIDLVLPPDEMVGELFRDLPAWESLEREIFPSMVGEHTGVEPFKIWSVGCSTGEESYTVVMLLDRYLKESGLDIDFRVLATDVNDDALAIARQGIYPAEAMEDVPEHDADAYFYYRRGGVVINGDLRKKIMFSEHDAAEDAPFSRTDLVICRNMLIYMTLSVQSRILASFSFSLKMNAALFSVPVMMSSAGADGDLISVVLKNNPVVSCHKENI